MHMQKLDRQTKPQRDNVWRKVSNMRVRATPTHRYTEN